MVEQLQSQAEVKITTSADGFHTIHLTGTWEVGQTPPSAEDTIAQIDSIAPPTGVTFETSQLTGWDSTLLTYLTAVINHCAQQGISVDKKGLPEGVNRLLSLAAAVPERKGARREAIRQPVLSRIGERTIGLSRSAADLLGFVGEVFIAFVKLLQGRASFRRSDLWLTLQECGVHALPIVTLISMLVGLILAFVGAVQLRVFGAQLFVASLVGIAMVRVMGAVMTGVIMAGRTGARFAAEIGTMQVNEEIDALVTLGISPVEFLVLPRVLALTIMMPLLCLYADLMGILGGFLVGVGMLDLNVMEYYYQTEATVTLNNLWIGLFHSFVFGILIALAGCLRGMQCGRSADAVGSSTTSAVVSAIVAIVVATAIITIILDILGL